MFFFGFEGKVRRLRKTWCKLRLRTLKMKEKNVLNMLDDIDQQLRTLEEQELTRFDRSRILSEVEDSLKNVETALKSKKERY
ncbi:MAG: hypothetical protein B6U88_01255 [Candidatus Aenigmarchaeota archaeon ex4484_56]|nr:MAG: hypothetical protein B6U88_01255 [Candidatus Aenigmarchaeota archaeon ex4484_56]